MTGFFFFSSCFLAGLVIFSPSLSHQHSISGNHTYTSLWPDLRLKVTHWHWHKIAITCYFLDFILCPDPHCFQHSTDWIYRGLVVTLAEADHWFSCLQQNVSRRTDLLQCVFSMNKDSAGEAVKLPGKTPTLEHIWSSILLHSFRLHLSSLATWCKAVSASPNRKHVRGDWMAHPNMLNWHTLPPHCNFAPINQQLKGI